MDARWIALVLFALLAGLGGSFVFSYIIYQPQIESLRAEIKEMQGQIADLRSSSLSLNTLLELQSEMGRLKSTLLNLNSMLVELNDTLQRLLSSEPYIRYEKLEIISIYAEIITNGFKITVSIKNTGSADASIDNLLLNGKSYDEFGTGAISVSGTVGDSTYTLPTSTIPLKVGQGGTIVITINTAKVSGTNPFVSGVSVEVRLHSAAGQEYPKTITLP